MYQWQTAVILSQEELDVHRWELDNQEQVERDTHCGACGGLLDSWQCELLCSTCGVRFTCDE